MQAQIQNYKGSRCLKLASPRKLYDSLLVGVSKEFGEEEKNVFRFSFRRDLRSSILESPDPLKWFRHLEEQGNLSWNNVSSLIEFLKEASRGELVSEVRNYQARIKIIGFFQKHLKENLPELMCIDGKLDRKWTSEQELPKNFLMKCQRLFRTQNDDESRNHVRCFFSKGIALLVNSCRPTCNDDVQSACLKLLYLSDLFHNRFKKIIVEDKELLNIKPLPSGKFLARDTRRRTSVGNSRRSSVRDEVQQQLSHRRISREVIQRPVQLLWSFLLSLFTGLLGMLRGDEHLNENNEIALEGDLSD